MIATWMLYSAAVGVLIAGVAWAAEQAFAHLRLPRRGAWVLGIALSVAVPIGALVPGSAGETSGVGVGDVRPLAAADDAPATPQRRTTPISVPDWLLLALWATGSTALLLRSRAAVHGVSMLRRACTEHLVDGVAVLVSPAYGPAVAGLLAPRVIVPEWALSLDADARRLLLEHEGEHLRARDPLALALSIGALVVLPWSPALWWQHRRLRVAIEIDCDARVIARTGELRRYGDLLIEVGRRVAPGRPLALALSEPRSTLTRRIDIMTRQTQRRARYRAAAFAVTAVALVGAMAAVPAPDVRIELATGSLPMVAGETGGPVPVDTPYVERVGAEPTFTPYDVKPTLTNREEFVRALEAGYPPVLREAGVGGTVVLHVFIDETGTVRNTEIHTGSGRADLDEAARAVMRVAKFSPARNEGKEVPVWIALPVSFRRLPYAPPAPPAEPAPDAALVPADLAPPEPSPAPAPVPLLEPWRAPAPGEPARAPAVPTPS